MLRALTIRNFILIDHIDITFCEGLTVLTGETGAGKSIVLDALAILLGGKFDASMRRTGPHEHTPFSIAAEFDASPSVCDFLKSHNIAIHDEDGLSPSLLIRRSEDHTSLKTHGTVRLRNFINDQPVTRDILIKLAPFLLDIHGQFDHFFSKHAYRTCLDHYGNTIQVRDDVKKMYEAWKKAEHVVADLNAQKETLDDRLFDIDRTLKELHALAPQPMEETEKLKERETLRETARNVSVLHDVAGIFNENFIRHIIEAQKKLNVCIGYEHIVARLETIILELQDIDYSIAQDCEAMHDHAQRLTMLDDRLHALRRLARVYKVSGDTLHDLEARLMREKEELDQLDLHCMTAERACQNARRDYIDRALKLHAQRHIAAQKICDRMRIELPDLKLAHAQFHITVDHADLDTLTLKDAAPHGIDHVRFLFSANPGMPLQEMEISASGGELSRLMLALKVVLHEQSQPEIDTSVLSSNRTTLIFDEIDSGVSGSTSTAMGVRLKKLSCYGSVIVITHSPQVTAFCDHHYTVQKFVEHGHTHVQLTTQHHDDHLNELARMLSGHSVTPESLKAAQSLREQALRLP